MPSLAPLPLLALLMVMGCSVLPFSSAAHRYVWGNALADGTHAMGPDGEPYPSALIEELYNAGQFGGSPRHGARGRTLFGNILDPGAVSEMLMRAQEGGQPSAARGRSLFQRSTSSSGRAAARNLVASNVNVNLKLDVDDKDTLLPEGRSENETQPEEGEETPFVGGCPSAPPAQLCPTKYNTTAPMWGTSLTSGKRVTIVQKFPDLLQQVIFHECTTDQCDFIHGRCTQTFTPYLFLVIPLGPVTLTGQDYVMVESGCACQPKYSSGSPYDTPLDAFLG